MLCFGTNRFMRTSSLSIHLTHVAYAGLRLDLLSNPRASNQKAWSADYFSSGVEATVNAARRREEPILICIQSLPDLNQQAAKVRNWSNLMLEFGDTDCRLWEAIMRIECCRLHLMMLKPSWTLACHYSNVSTKELTLGLLLYRRSICIHAQIYE